MAPKDKNHYYINHQLNDNKRKKKREKLTRVKQKQITSKYYHILPLMLPTITSIKSLRDIFTKLQRRLITLGIWERAANLFTIQRFAHETACVPPVNMQKCSNKCYQKHVRGPWFIKRRPNLVIRLEMGNE